MARLKLRIVGMHCGHCQMKVEQALKSVTGTQGVAVFRAEGEAEVDFDAAQAAPDRYLNAVREAGYAASVMD
ncbi:MAG TPA: heavy-metal-associated domain-containing protein [Gemmatimonadales bacterium]|nr:heavy-metal-associated domain-containing protein [Gemmatimonadales bacterium]